MDCAAYPGIRNLYNSSPTQVTLPMLLIHITHFIKNSAKDPKLKRVWLMITTHSQLPKKSVQSPHIDLFLRTLLILSHTPDSSAEKTVFRGIRQTSRHKHGNKQQSLWHFYVRSLNKLGILLRVL